MGEMTDGSGLGLGQMAELTRRVQEDWRGGRGAEAEQIEVCDCCGDWVGFADPGEREMADQWREAMIERARVESLRAGGSGPGWPGPEILPDDVSTGWPGSRTPEWYWDSLL